jgi:hypothetical protein
VTRSGKRRESREPERQPRSRAGGLHRDFACEWAVARPKPPARKNYHNVKILNIAVTIFIQTIFLRNCTKNVEALFAGLDLVFKKNHL